MDFTNNLTDRYFVCGCQIFFLKCSAKIKKLWMTDFEAWRVIYFNCLFEYMRIYDTLSWFQARLVIINQKKLIWFLMRYLISVSTHFAMHLITFWVVLIIFSLITVVNSFISINKNKFGVKLMFNIIHRNNISRFFRIIKAWQIKDSTVYKQCKKHC